MHEISIFLLDELQRQIDWITQKVLLKMTSYSHYHTLFLSNDYDWI